MINKVFKGRKLLIATKHEKEKAIAPILEKELGVRCFVPTNFDTDTLGTFSGEIQREADALTTARTKCLLAMEQFDCDLAIASEGSFGPHPEVFCIPVDEELLLLVDKKNEIEIFVRELSTNTNFHSAEIRTEAELAEFAKNAKFPSHGLIIRQASYDFLDIVKGITEMDQLIETFNYFIKKYNSLWIETDMRAMYNPSRMIVIEKACLRLAEMMNSLCPICYTPGFGITEGLQGLPCKVCQTATSSILSYTYACKKCKYRKEEKFPNGKFQEEPMYCDVCNP